MELKDFISETIVQIADGINQAIERCKKENLDVIINPDVSVGKEGDKFIPTNKEKYRIERRVQEIEMDISVNVTETNSSNQGAKIGVSVLNFGVSSSGQTSSTNVHHVRFSIPVSLPITDVEELKGNKNAS